MDWFEENISSKKLALMLKALIEADIDTFAQIVKLGIAFSGKEIEIKAR
ncbi:hypothetical protein [Halanaerobium saccharolyticum]|nr:hypothetical protein [Halanaerobium saccharolyticum]